MTLAMKNVRKMKWMKFIFKPPDTEFFTITKVVCSIALVEKLAKNSELLSHPICNDQ